MFLCIVSLPIFVRKIVNALNHKREENSKMLSFSRETSRDEFIRRAFNKSGSVSSQRTAKYALVSLEKFTQAKYSCDLESTIAQLKKTKGKEKFRFLQDYIDHLHELSKSQKTILVYFSWVKLYLRRAKGIELYNEDVKDLVMLPKVPTIQRKPLTMEIMKTILDNSKETQKALYLTLLSSGMRLREALSLRKCDFDFSSDPVRVTIQAQFTKDREERGTFISSEARDIVLRISRGLGPNEQVFTTQEDLQKAVFNEEKVFDRIRKNCGFEEKYSRTGRNKVNIHAFRAFFITTAAQVIDHFFAHALAGHHAYLEQYYRLTPEQQSNFYKKLETSLLVYGSAEIVASQNDQIEKLTAEKSMLEKRVERIEQQNQDLVKGNARMREMESTLEFLKSAILDKKEISSMHVNSTTGLLDRKDVRKQKDNLEKINSIMGVTPHAF